MGEKNLVLKRGGLRFSTRSVAVFSICVYIIIVTTFETVGVGNVTFAAALSSCALYLCLACCGVNVLMKGKVRITWIMLAMFVFGVILSISCLYSPASSDYIGSNIYRYWTSFVLVVLASTAIESFEDIKKILYSYIIAGISLSIEVYLYFGLDGILNASERMANKFFGNVNQLGMYWSVAIVMAIYVMFVLKGNKLFCIASWVLCFPLVLFSGSRKALLAVVVSIIVFVFVLSKNRSVIIKVASVSAIVGILLLLVYTLPAFSTMRERLEGTLGLLGGNVEVAGDSNRVLFITKGWEAFLQSPVIGNGFGYSYFLFGTYSHNNYIELLMCNGIIGLVSYYFIYIKMLFDVKKIKQNKPVYALVVVMITRFLFEGIGYVGFYERMSLLWIGVLASSILVSSKEADAVESTTVQKE